MDRVIVLGAGLAGLGCARHLPGCRVFEAAAHPGGHAYSHRAGGVAFDQGAHICHSKDEELLALIGAETDRAHRIEPSTVRNVYRGGWLTYPVQNHLHELPTHERVRALTDLVRAHAERPEAGPADYLAWCRAQYGEYLTEEFYKPFTAKYWRVAMGDLGTDWLGGRLMPSQLDRVVAGAFGVPAPGQAVFARFRYPRAGGFFGFFAPLYDGLPIAYGERAVELDTTRRTVTFASGHKEHYDALASSIPLPDLIAITADAPGELRAAARRLRHTQLLCVNLIVDRPALTDCHWFYVYDGDIDAARVSVPSNLAPGSVPPGRTALQAEVFRRDDEPLDVDALTERVTRQLGRLLGFDPARDVSTVAAVPVRRAYVISDHARGPAVAALTSWLEERGVHSMGLYGRWKYIWSDEAYRQGRDTARAILARAGRRAA